MTDKNTGTSEGTGIVEKDRYIVKVIVIAAVIMAILTVALYVKYKVSAASHESESVASTLPSSGFWQRTNVSYPADESPIMDVRFDSDDGRPHMVTSYTLNNGGQIHGEGYSDDGTTFYVKENGFDIVYRFDASSHGSGTYNNTRGGTDNFEMKKL